MTDKLLEMVKNKYPLTEKSAGEFSELRVKGMKFRVRAYDAAGLGRVSVMTAKGFFGLMKMDTVIVDPLEADLPIFSYDRILAAGNDTLIIEMYDSLLGELSTAPLSAVADKYSSLPDRDPGEHWYDGIKLSPSVSKKGKKVSEEFDRLAREFFGAYLDLPAAPVADREEKRRKASVYVEGLLENGGPSTDVFKKKLGSKATAELFRSVLFGTK